LHGVRANEKHPISSARSRRSASGEGQGARGPIPSKQPTAGLHAICVRPQKKAKLLPPQFQSLGVWPEKWLYLDWASAPPKPFTGDNFVHSRWINAGTTIRIFSRIVDFPALRVGRGKRPAQGQDLCRRLFSRRAVALETLLIPRKAASTDGPDNGDISDSVEGRRNRAGRGRGARYGIVASVPEGGGPPGFQKLLSRGTSAAQSKHPSRNSRSNAVREFRVKISKVGGTRGSEKFPDSSTRRGVSWRNGLPPPSRFRVAWISAAGSGKSPCRWRVMHGACLRWP